jgi:hypothetical protein
MKRLLFLVLVTTSALCQINNPGGGASGNIASINGQTGPAYTINPGVNIGVDNSTANQGTISFQIGASASTGQILVDSAGSLGGISNSTSGFVLTSNGSGVAPTFQNAAGGGNVSNSGTPTANAVPTWVDATHIKGGLFADNGTTGSYSGTGGFNVSGGVLSVGAGSPFAVLASVTGAAFGGPTGTTACTSTAAQGCIRLDTNAWKIAVPGAAETTLPSSVTSMFTVSSTGQLSTIRTIGYAFGDPANSSALTTSSRGYVVSPVACTIQAWDINVDAGTATIDIWKVASGTAIPTVSNTITASATPAISTGTSIHSTTLTGWTTTVAANDIIGYAITAVSTAKFAYIDFQCK